MNENKNRFKIYNYFYMLFQIDLIYFSMKRINNSKYINF